LDTTTQSRFENISDEVLLQIFTWLDPAETWNFGCTSRSTLLTLPKDKHQAFRKHLTRRLQKTREAFLRAIDFEQRSSSTLVTLLTLYNTCACTIFLTPPYQLSDNLPWARYGVPIASALAMGICRLLVKRYHASFSQQEYIDFINLNTEVDTRMHEPEPAYSFIEHHGRSVHQRKYFILYYEMIACSALMNVMTSLSLHHDTYKKEDSGRSKNGPGFAIVESIVLGLPLLYLATWGMIYFFTPPKRVLTANRAVNVTRQTLVTLQAFENASETKPPELPPQTANERSGPTEPLLVTVGTLRPQANGSTQRQPKRATPLIGPSQ
jgi:hypothetical protein